MVVRWASKSAESMEKMMAAPKVEWTVVHSVGQTVEKTAARWVEKLVSTMAEKMVAMTADKKAGWMV